MYSTRVKVIIFKNLQGAQILTFFCENWHEASFYIKKQTQKYKFEIILLKSTVPPKKCVFVFWRKPPNNFFLVFWLSFSFKNNRRTYVLLVIFFKRTKKSYWPSKTPFWPFLAVNNGFLWVFKNIDQNNICLSIVLKAKTGKKIWKQLVDPQKGHFWVLK